MTKTLFLLSFYWGMGFCILTFSKIGNLRIIYIWAIFLLFFFFFTLFYYPYIIYNAALALPSTGNKREKALLLFKDILGGDFLKAYISYTPMKRSVPWSEPVDLISDDSSSDTDMEVNNGDHCRRSSVNVSINPPAKEMIPEDVLIRRAEMYQEYMKAIPIPSIRGSVIPFSSWMGLGRSIKKLYGQPLHYLTNILLKQWDELRVGSDDEHMPLDFVIHPCKAEASIWLTEEIHRRTSSYHHVARLWLSDPMHHAFVDPIFPEL